METVQWSQLFSPELLEKQQKGNPFRKLNDTVYEMLENAIVSCSIPPGERLNTTMIAELMNISRTPVKEAMEQLMSKGLVVDTPEKKGYFVFDISHTSLKHMFEARNALECAAVYLCAQRSCDMKLAELKRLAELFAVSIEKNYFNRFAMIDQAFHHLIVDSCGNPLIIKMYETIDTTNKYYSIRSQDYLKSIGKDAEFRVTLGQHLAIYRAIELGMPELAEQAMKNHLNSGYNLCLRYHMTMGNNV